MNKNNAPVLFNGLTAAETTATASCMGLVSRSADGLDDFLDSMDLDEPPPVDHSRLKFDGAVDARNRNLIHEAIPRPDQFTAVNVALVGTMYTHGEGHDYDYVVLVAGFNRAASDLQEAGFVLNSPDGYEVGQFASFRAGDVNVMLTEDEEFFDKFVAAAQVCKYVEGLLAARWPESPGSLDREQRVKIHRIIMNGEGGAE
jgi:hypothetical protein